MRPLIVDCIIASYEVDAVAVRTTELADVVDARVITVARSTFNGRRPVPPDRYLRFWGLMVAVVTVDLPDGLDPMQSEEWLRDQSLIHARVIHGDDNLFIVADGDEIPHPDAITVAARTGAPAVLHTDYRQWWMDWRGPDAWQLVHQPVIGTAADYDRAGGAHAARITRMAEAPVVGRRGWHLSTLGDAGLAARKLASFGHDEYAGPAYTDYALLDGYRRAGRDLLNRFDLEPTTDLPRCADRFPHLLSRSARAS